MEPIQRRAVTLAELDALPAWIWAKRVEHDDIRQARLRRVARCPSGAQSSPFIDMSLDATPLIESQSLYGFRQRALGRDAPIETIDTSSMQPMAPVK